MEGSVAKDDVMDLEDLQDDSDEYEGSSSSVDDEEEEEGLNEDPEKCIDLFHHDMGDGACFRPGTFDGCISISALQWLCHSNRSRENPKTRLTRLFNTLFGSLSRGARAVFQFYPETSTQIDLILGCAMKAGFTGGLVVDFPNSTRAKKYYLCLMTGRSAELPEGLQEESEASSQVGIGKRSRKRQYGQRSLDKTRNNVTWVKAKKELARSRGQSVKADSKYTARKRKIHF